MFWDASALASLILPESRSDEIAALFDRDARPALWWGTAIECHAALARAVRERRPKSEEVQQVRERLRDLRSRTFEIAPIEDVRTRALRLFSAHSLRAADALQLAAALTWCEEQPSGESFVCLDKRLRDAARREGFTVIPDASAGT